MWWVELIKIFDILIGDLRYLKVYNVNLNKFIDNFLEFTDNSKKFSPFHAQLTL